MRWALRASIVLSGRALRACGKEGAAVQEEERENGSLPAPPPPYEQVASCEQSESRASDAGSDEPLLERGSVSACPVAKRGRAIAEGEKPQANGDDDRRAKLHRGAVAAAVACAAALAVAVGALVVGLNDRPEVDEDRVIDSRPAAASAKAEPSAEASEVEAALFDQLSALVADEDAALTGYVERFMAAYDAAIDPESSYRFCDLGITPEELVDKLKAGLAFKIESVDVYGGKAWVEVSVSSKSFSEQADAFAAKVAGAALDHEDAEAYKAYLKEALLDSFDGVKVRPGSALVVVDRGEDGWGFSSDDVASLLGAAWYGR